MERIAALVEGHTELHFIKNTYANSIVSRPIPNGKSVSISLIVESIVDAVQALGGEIKRVIILLDREGRDITSSEMAIAIIDGVGAICSGRKFYVGVADIQIENWMLADEQMIRSVFNEPDFIYPGDGVGSKNILHRISGGVMMGPADKAALLKKASALTGSKVSPSLEAFRGSIDFDWYWAIK